VFRSKDHKLKVHCFNCVTLDDGMIVNEELGVILRGIMVSVLAIEPKVRGVKPGRGRWIFKGYKNPQHAFLQGEVKPSAPCRKILRHVKDPFEV
jgi:hypothetical protein